MNRARKRVADGLVTSVGEMATVDAGAVDRREEHHVHGQAMGGGDAADALPEAGIADVGCSGGRPAIRLRVP